MRRRASPCVGIRLPRLIMPVHLVSALAVGPSFSWEPLLERSRSWVGHTFVFLFSSPGSSQLPLDSGKNPMSKYLGKSTLKLPSACILSLIRPSIFI
ncbi:hypothetical protein BDV41DRAFT_543911 [Aspergillus transmontanensis]|uniref:Secreted protein n=1 Tax=Aspergillus transmontanensis TaxID=1034304 RepID=A0A5N6VQJ4_9EURO|nr:hypothetical protein BDV41DRAFT_543911 [Aspergillus transmontanensis]